jgi:hypothetical protein
LADHPALRPEASEDVRLPCDHPCESVPSSEIANATVNRVVRRDLTVTFPTHYNLYKQAKSYRLVIPEAFQVPKVLFLPKRSLSLIFSAGIPARKSPRGICIAGS